VRPGNIKAHTTVIQIGDNPFPVTAEPGLLPHPAFEDLDAADGNGNNIAACCYLSHLGKTNATTSIPFPLLAERTTPLHAFPNKWR